MRTSLDFEFSNLKFRPRALEWLETFENISREANTEKFQTSQTLDMSLPFKSFSYEENEWTAIWKKKKKLILASRHDMKVICIVKKWITFVFLFWYLNLAISKEIICLLSFLYLTIFLLDYIQSTRSQSTIKRKLICHRCQEKEYKLNK